MELSFRYHADLIGAVKRTVPPHSRSYDPGSRTWTVREPFVDPAIGLLLEIFPDARIEAAGGERRADQPPSRRPMARADHFTTLYLVPGAPPEVIKAAYKALFKLHHPDLVTGDEAKLRATRAMAAINAAAEALRAEGGR